MCGIGGWSAAGPGSDDQDAVGLALATALGHRGPDGHWVEHHGGYGLVQARLSVVDLSGAVHYPMPNESGDVRLLFNGEIYGHTALRQELEALGHRFRTRCDAEVVVHGYEEWGTDVLRRLDGMFALAIYDDRRGDLVLARDALGIKPLVHTTSGPFAFASDVMALVRSGLSRGRVDHDALLEFAALHYIPSPRTGVEDVRHVEPGSFVVRSRDGRVRSERWRPLPFSAEARSTPMAGPASGLDLGRTLDEAVRRQLEADVEVGVLLSSGLDSSLILDSAVRSGIRPTAFTIGFAGHGDYDEQSIARRFARDMGVEHLVGELELSFDESIARVVGAYDQPFADASAIATVALAELARPHVTVALSGTGGDDLFAGYYRHRAHRLNAVTRLVPPRLRRALTSSGASSGRERRSALALRMSYARRLLRSAASDPVDQYLDIVGRTSSPALLALLGADPGSSMRRIEALAEERGLRDGSAGTTLDRLQAFETQTYLPSDLLVKEDRATMSVGLEGRVPLLSNDMLALAERTPSRERTSLRQGKLPLRALAQERLPAYLTKQRKRGFAVPLGSLMDGAWREPVRSYLRESSSDVLPGADAAGAVARGELTATDAWAACVLVGWERRLAAARVA